MQLRRRGQDVPARHQTLAAALAWSYEQLPPAARALFARLSIFPGGWGADAAAAVCDLEGWGRAALFDALDVLLDHSLLHRQAEGELARLSLLAMVREFAQARLAERAEGEQLQRRLLAYCLDLAEQARKEMGYGPSLAIWTARLDAEHDSLRAALAYAFESGDYERGLRLASALRMFWYTRGYLREGRRWLERFLDLAASAPRPIAPALRAAALDDAGVLAWRQGDYRQAESLGADATAIYRRIGDSDGAARSLMHLGLIAFDRGDTATSRARFESSLALYRAIDNPIKTVSVLHNLANLHNQLNESELALPLYAECLAIYQQTDDSSGIALVSLGMGAIYRDQADVARAVAAFNRSRALASELGDDWSAAVATLNLGDIAADMGDYPAARLQLGAALAQFEQIGDQQLISTAHGRLGDVELLAGDVAAAVGRFRQCLMLASAIEFQHGIAGGLEGLAGCAALEQPELAARLLGCAAAIRAATGVPIPLADQPRYDRLLQLAQSHLSPAAWALAWDEGARLPAARAVSLALSAIAPR
jgi:tetratricopeptide (TPR) repeat protein